MSDKICIVGIAGGTASGKTSIAKKIVDACAPDKLSLVKEKVKIEDADAIKEAILAAGGVVEYK